MPAVIVIIMFVGGFYSYLSKGNVKITRFEGTKATAVSVVSAKSESGAKNSEAAGSAGEVQEAESSGTTGDNEAEVSDPFEGQSVYKNGKVNLNTAKSEDLQVAPGIGPAKAQKIIDYREQYGGFSYLEELMEIKGIGQKTFDKIKDFYYVE